MSEDPMHITRGQIRGRDIVDVPDVECYDRVVLEGCTNPIWVPWTILYPPETKGPIVLNLIPSPIVAPTTSINTSYM